MRALVNICLATALFVAARLFAQQPGLSSPFNLDPHDGSRIISGNVQTAWVRHYGSGLAPSSDEPIAMAVDDSGNVHVTGRSSIANFGYDYLTVKYDSSGKQLWAARYNGSETSIDEASALVLDSFGNVYVTGKSWIERSGWDCVTIKYNSNGLEQWVVRYDGPESRDDTGVALDIDALGNIYVSGTSFASSTLLDIVTIKYNSSGTQQWVRRYEGSGESNEVAEVIAVDSLGNVHVAGTSSKSGDSDYLTIKYDSNGTAQWDARYSESDSDKNNLTGLALDNFGNVYVAGGSVFRGITIKYDRMGNKEWIFQQAEGKVDVIAIDRFGYVYCAGGHGGAFLIKCDTFGNRKWVIHGSQPDHEVIALTSDTTGNVYVAGTTFNSYQLGNDNGYDEYVFATVKYDSTGTRQWGAWYRARANTDYATAIGADRNGNVYVTGKSYASDYSFDYATIKYNSAGKQQWVATYRDSGQASDYAKAICVDKEGNAVVTGASYADFFRSNFSVIKYDADGDSKWATHFRSDEMGELESPTTLAIDDSGSIYVAGIAGRFDKKYYITVKYDPLGILQWSAKYGSVQNNNLPVLAIGELGNAYISVAIEHNYHILKYNADGMEQWVSQYAVTSPGDRPVAMKVDDSGNVYVVGSIHLDNNYGDFLTIKYDKNGSQIWSRSYHLGNDYPSALAIDDSNNVYVVGYGGGFSDKDYIIIKYTSAGIQQWDRQYKGAGNYEDIPTAVAVDSWGNVYVTGRSWGADSGFDFATVKYNSSGDELWVNQYSGTENLHSEARALAIDSEGDVYVAGLVSSNSVFSSSGDFAVIKYSAAGEEVWLTHYDGPGNSDDQIVGITVDNNDNIFVAGTSRVSGGTYFTVIKYAASPSSVYENRHEQLLNYDLAQNFPNPFNPSTTIHYRLAKAGHAKLQIFDLTGREVATLVNEIKSGGAHEAHWNAAALPSGIYLYRLEVSNSAANSKPIFIQTRKLILMK